MEAGERKKGADAAIAQRALEKHFSKGPPRGIIVAALALAVGKIIGGQPLALVGEGRGQNPARPQVLPAPVMLLK